MPLGPIRPFFATIIGAMLAVAVADLIVGRHVATYDAVISAVTGARDTYTVRRVPSAGGGLRVGERVHLLDARAGSRLGAQAPATPLRVQGENGAIVTLQPQTTTPSAFYRLWDVVRVAVLLLALTILLLRGKTTAGFALAAFLSLTAFFSVAVSDPQIGSWFRTVYVGAQGPLGAIQTLALLVLLDALGTDSLLRRRILRIGIWLCLAAAAYQTVGVVLLATTGLLLPLVDSVSTGGIIDVVLLCYAIFSLVVSLATTRGADRRRLAIVGCVLVIGEFSIFYNVVTTGNFGAYGTVQAIIGEASLAIMAIGLTYAILVEHLFDIGFVVNRAVVYGAISAIVVPVFIAVEWAVERWAGGVGSNRGAIIEMLVAVAIGLSLRPLHAWVDRVVDNLLFAQRHRAANALTRYAHEAHLVGEPRKLFEATLWTLRTFARARDCDILLRDDDRTFRSAVESPRRMHEDDVLVLRLRDGHEPVLRSSFPGLVDADVALPMLVRGTLTGIVLVALPERAEQYSPEELHALALVAREVAFALVALDAAEAKRLREEIAALRARLLIAP